MARDIAQGAVAAVTPAVVPDVTFARARHTDESELRALLRENFLPGWVSLSYEREPDYFLADSVEGDRQDTLAARETATGRLVGMFSRAYYDVYINGRVARLGYLGQLRVAPDYRGKIRHLRAGYEACHQLLHEPHETPYYLTSILADNRPARRLLAAGIEGLPTYQELEPYSVLVIATHPSSFRHRARRAAIDAATDETFAEIVQCLQRNNARYQFAPHWTEFALRSPRCRGLRPSDFLIARDNGQVVGCLAIWDQRGFKRYVVRGLDARLASLRGAINLVAPLFGFPRIPAVGEKLDQAYLSHVAIDGDDPEILLGLVEAGRREAARRGLDAVLLGLAERHPLRRAVKRVYRCLEYRSLLYLVHWDDGAPAAQAPDRRIANPEAAIL